MKKNIALVLWIATGIVLATLLALAFRPEPLKVETARAERGPLQVTVDEDGETRARDRYLVVAPVSGRIERIELHEGDAVNLDMIVARMQPLPLSAREREEQTARVAAAEALAREAEQRVRHAQTDADQADRDRERLEKLVAQGFVSPQAAEQSKVTAATTRNELDAARFRLQSARADARAARASLLAVKPQGPAGVIELRSPVAGRVLRIPERSERVVAAGAPIMILGNPGELEIVVDVLSTEAVKVKPGMPVLIEGWGGDRTLHARVRTVEPYAFTKVSALGVEEQRVNVIADFVDPPDAIGDGYKIDARIVIWEEKDVLRVPASAIFRIDGGWALFSVDEAHARRTPVEVGERNATHAQILKGLEAGALVIRHPSNELADGTRVETR